MIEEPRNVEIQEADETPGEADSAKKVVRLSVGQELTGKVKQVTDFGAFVDIGAGRDGLVHISELSVGRVTNVKEIVEEGQSVTVWIKRLNRERNRISLTMISPDTRTIRDLQEGEVVEGVVTRMVPYGAFINIGVGTDALLHVREMGNNYVEKPEDVVEIDEKLEVRIMTVNRRRRHIDVSIKGCGKSPKAMKLKQPMGNPLQKTNQIRRSLTSLRISRFSRQWSWPSNAPWKPEVRRLPCPSPRGAASVVNTVPAQNRRRSFSALWIRCASRTLARFSPEFGGGRIRLPSLFDWRLRLLDLASDQGG